MKSILNALEKFFGVAVRGQTYLNALYLLLAFPLGLFYFIFLVTGLAMGVPLVIIWVGLLILVAVFAVWYMLIAFERKMAIWLLREDIPPMVRPTLTSDAAPKSLWQQFTAALANPVTWKGLVYLIAKFPLGVLSFVALVTTVSVSGAFLTAPLYYRWVGPEINLTIYGTWWNPYYLVDTLPEALLLSLVGVFLMLISMHILNGLAWVSGKFARIMLGNFSAAPVAPVETPAAPEVETPETGTPALPV